jgi:hypothetical protein
MVFSFQEWDGAASGRTGRMVRKVWTAQPENFITVVRMNFLVNGFSGSGKAAVTNKSINFFRHRGHSRRPQAEDTEVSHTLLIRAVLGALCALCGK